MSQAKQYSITMLGLMAVVILNSANRKIFLMSQARQYSVTMLGLMAMVIVPVLQAEDWWLKSRAFLLLLLLFLLMCIYIYIFNNYAHLSVVHVRTDNYAEQICWLSFAA